ncbi:hypothetical protein ACFQNJ_16985 [Hydrogenophaga bisanensis]|uniref:Ferredoxin n=1 Tax=Hydrogenophaga bisanensis TaxID=439611 RepID=A0ABW2RDN1_9BURK
MKLDSLTIGPAPWNEDCAMVGCSEYPLRSRNETEAFKRQILRHYPVPAGVDHAGVRICCNPHEFGTYREVEVAFNPVCEQASAWAYKVEADPKAALARWDDQAKMELGLLTEVAV